MVRLISMVVITGLALILSGCMTMTLEGDGNKTGKSDSGKDTMHGSLYGYNWSTPEVDKCKNGHGLYRVRYYTDASYLLVSVISLGAYVPQTVEWWCDAKKENNEDEEIF